MVAGLHHQLSQLGTRQLKSVGLWAVQESVFSFRYQCHGQRMPVGTIGIDTNYEIMEGYSLVM